MTTNTHPIQFGTSGHRGIMGQTFTNHHITAICAAIATYYQDHPNTRLMVGYDTRTGNSPELQHNSYTKTIVDTLTSYGIEVWITETYTPTPVISWAIVHHHLDGGLILTASHNPPNYNGIKFNASDGAPANIQTTTEIEKMANHYFQTTCPPPSASIDTTLSTKLKRVNPIPEFATTLHHNIQTTLHCPNISQINIPVSIDCKHGSVGDTWHAILNGFVPYTLLHARPKPDFGGTIPNPVQQDGLEALRTHQQDHNTQLAIANDPDGDRHILLDENGTFVTPEETATIILDFIATEGLPINGIASTVASSSLIKSAATQLNIPYIETNVGFKYFTSFLKECRHQNKTGLAVESSGGISWSTHTLEKCGFFTWPTHPLHYGYNENLTFKIKTNHQYSLRHILF